MGNRRLKKMGFSTRSVHAGKPKTNAVRSHAVPIYQTVNFEYRNFDELVRVGQEKQKGYFYSRYGNPTLDALNGAMAELEEGEAAFAFASGMAAITSAFLSLTKPGDHVLSSSLLYGGSHRFLSETLPGLGVEVTFVHPFATDALEKGFRWNTKVLYAEPLVNPTLGVVDIRRWAESAEHHRVFFLVDNTFTPPPLFQPLRHGVHGVVHSTTKYIEGHGDTLGGTAVGQADWIGRIRDIGKIYGGIMSPFNAWLTLRGLRTLSIRMHSSSGNASVLADFLQGHSKVIRVHYPGLAGHPQHELAKSQFKGFGAMVAFEIQGGLKAVRMLCDAFRIITSTVSLGEVDTIVSHPASSSHAGMSSEERVRVGIPDGLLRLSVGIEDVDDLIGDLEQALGKV